MVSPFRRVRVMNSRFAGSSIVPDDLNRVDTESRSAFSTLKLTIRPELLPFCFGSVAAAKWSKVDYFCTSVKAFLRLGTELFLVGSLVGSPRG